MSLLPRRISLVVLFIVAALAFAVSLPLDDVFAQDDELPTDLEELKDERERTAREAAFAVRDIDVVTASVEEVTKALDEIAAFVEIQQIRLEEAESLYENSLTAVERAETEREDILVAADVLRSYIADLAVSSFTGEAGTANDEVTELILSDDPGESARFVHLLELQTGSLSDSIDQLRGLEVEAAALIIEQEKSALRAEDALREVESLSLIHI